VAVIIVVLPMPPIAPIFEKIGVEFAAMKTP
jgi:hypothetical protein